MMSLLLEPAGKGTTRRTGLVGYSCAGAAAESSTSATHAIRTVFMSSSSTTLTSGEIKPERRFGADDAPHGCVRHPLPEMLDRVFVSHRFFERRERPIAAP